MILVDSNLLIYAWNEDADEYERAHRWLEERLNGVEGVGMPWSSLLAYMRVISNPRVFSRPLGVDEAWTQVQRWIALDNVFVPEPADRYREILAALMPDADRSSLVHDAHLAALAIEYGLTLQTTDRDFARFRGLRWENPLEA